MARHGSRARYNAGCPCGACREANSEASRKRRARLREEAPPTFMVGGRVAHPPARPVELSPLGERSAEASAKAAAIRGSGEAAQRRRDRLEAEALAADLLDREDRLRAAKPPAERAPAERAPAVGLAAAERYGLVTPEAVAGWRALVALRRNPPAPPPAPAQAPRQAGPPHVAGLAEMRAMALAGRVISPPSPRPTRAASGFPADDGLDQYAEDLRRYISGQGPPPRPLERVGRR